MNGTPEAAAVLSFDKKISYWKVAIFKMVNGWFIVVGSSLAVAGIVTDHTTKIILILVGGSKFLEGFIDQEVGKAKQKIEADTQHFVKASQLAQLAKLAILTGLAAVLLSGCAWIKIYDHQRQAGFTAFMPAWPWQDSTAFVDHMGLVSRTNGFAANIRGMNQEEQTSTNAVDLLQKVTGAAVSAAVHAATAKP